MAIQEFSYTCKPGINLGLCENYSGMVLRWLIVDGTIPGNKIIWFWKNIPVIVFNNFIPNFKSITAIVTDIWIIVNYVKFYF